MQDTGIDQTTDVAPTNSPNYRWVVIVMWMISHMWGFIMIDSIGIFLPSIRNELGLSPIQAGWLGSAPHVANTVLAIPSGVFLSKFSPKPLTTVTMVLGIFTMMLMGWAPGFAILLVGRFLYGMTIVTREPARALLIKQWIKPKEVVIANSIIEIVWGLGAGLVILFPVILKLMDNSWRHTFYVFAGISLLITIGWQTLGRERVTNQYVAEIQSQSRSPIRRILKHKEIWLLAMATFGIGVAFSAHSTFWPSLMLDQYDMPLTKVATLRSIGGFVAAPAALGLGILMSRIGKKKLFLIIGGTTMASTFVGMLYTGNFLTLALMSIVNGLSMTIFPIFQTIPFELPGIRPREIVIATAIIRTAMMGGAISGPLIAGALQQVTGDPRLSLTTTGSMALMVTITAVFLANKWNLPTPDPILGETK